VSLFERPGVDRAALANQLHDAWLAELARRPLVEALQPRHDHRIVEEPAETLLVGDIALHVECKRIAVRKAERSEPSQREARCPDERVRVEDAYERDVHEEPLGLALCLGELAVLQVGMDDARVVSSIPVPPCRPRDKLEPQLHRA
jgi:hypothetical protein